MKKLLTLVILIMPILGFSQIPEKIKTKADSILICISTKQIFEKVFQYNCLRSATVINHTEWHDCDDLTNKQKRLFKKQNRIYKEKNFLIVYDCVLLDTIKGLVEIYLDKKGNIIRLSGIPNKENIQLLTGISISLEKAKEIAIKYGFETGENAWNIVMTFEKLEETQKYYWEITSTLILGDKTGCHKSGKILYIDAITGKIILESYWKSDCSN